MNDDRVFENKKAWFTLLCELGMPSIVIQKMLDISQSTVINYCMKLNKRNPYGLTESKPIMMKVYADLVCRYREISWGDKEFKNQLQPILADELEENRIIQTLEYALPAITSFTKIQYTDDVPEGYRRLLDGIFDEYYYTPPKIRNVWHEYLHNVSTSKITLTHKQFCWEKNQHFVGDIIQRYAETNRQYAAPMLTKEVCSLVDDIIERNCFGRIRSVIHQYYGIGCDPQTLEKIGDFFELSKEMIRLNRERGIKRLKKFLNKEIFPISNAWQEQQTMKQKHKQEIDVLTEEFKQNLFNLDRKNNPEKDDEYKDGYPEIFFKEIYDVDFSARVLYCLRDNVRYIWELLSYSESDLVKIRNFGKKSLQEVQRFLNQHNLRMGMRFTESQKLYFQQMIKQ